MSEYEFWDELGNIFNAIVAYQQKTIEFNKRFVNPWLRLGTVFDQNDHNAEALQAHKKALDIDQDNAANWLALGDVYFKMGAFDDAVGAYRRAIELNPKLGWAYANLALTCITQQNYTEAVNLYVKSLELITDEKDRSMIWNRLGNAYRKVNDYENAFIAFQMADECDGQNTGFQDKLDEVTVEQRVMPIVAEVYVNNKAESAVQEPAMQAEAVAMPEEGIAEIPAAEAVAVSSEPEAVEQIQVEEPIAEPAVETAPAIEAETNLDASPDNNTDVAPEASVEVETQSVESPVAEELEDELSELAELIEMVTMEEIVEEEPAIENEPATAEDTATDNDQPVLEAATEVPAAPVETEIEAETEAHAGEEAPAETESATAETVVEDEPLTENAAEAPVMEAVIETVQTEATEEVSTTEAPIEGAEEAVIAAAADEVDQPEVTAEAHTEEIVAEETNVEAKSEEEPIAAQIPAVEFVQNDASADTTVTPVMAHTVETFADPSSLNQPVVLVVEDLAELIGQVAGPGSDSQAKLEAVEEVDDTETAEIAPVEESTLEAASPDPIQTEVMSETDATEANPEQAYEEFIADAPEVAVSIVEEQSAKPMQTNELKVEPDTKNAHVWNELGNVYFNTGAFEEAMTAYSKAIELDDWFAWPYSNLALVYVQKEKYAEAILLYQRSIELFSSDKDKAITWNRLGNVYRRLNDYDNAIACYQRADDLDPNNATRSLRSRFSLLGSLSIEQAPSLAV